MFVKLFLVFVLVPLFELYLLIKVGSHLGALNTLIVVILTGIVGASLARIQGMRTMIRVRNSLNRGELPTEELLDALLIFMAGLLLLTPGFITDFVGMALLVPSIRSWFKGWLRTRFRRWIEQNRADIIIS
jgi:UPF0716 protein FxsA